MEGDADRLVMKRRNERNALVAEFGEPLADYSAVPPPASVEAASVGTSHGMYTMDKDGNKKPIKPPSTDNDLDLEDSPGVQFEKKVGDMIYVCAKNKKGNFVEIGRRIEDDDGNVKLSLKIEKKDG